VHQTGVMFSRLLPVLLCQRLREHQKVTVINRTSNHRNGRSASGRHWVRLVEPAYETQCWGVTRKTRTVLTLTDF
jgi:hypothetical protein